MSKSKEVEKELDRVSEMLKQAQKISAAKDVISNTVRESKNDIPYLLKKVETPEELKSVFGKILEYANELDEGIGELEKLQRKHRGDIE